MKPTIFRITKKEKLRTEHEPISFKDLKEQIANLTKAIDRLSHSQSFQLEKEKNQQQVQQSQSNVEARDRQILFQLIQLIDHNNENGNFKKEKMKMIKKWLAKVIKNIVSSSFYWYSKSEITFNQAKVFCAENIFLNLKRLQEKYKITGEQFKQIDKFIQQQILPYLATKYPLTQSNQVSKKLQQAIREVDSLDTLRNDYFYSSKIKLQYRQSGNYNDLIMRVLNDLMQRIDLVEKDEKLSAYHQFETLMTTIFEKVQNQNWMNKKSVNLDVIDMKYKEKVKEYTHYLIGRKFSQNTNLYTEQQIESLHLVIKSPQVLRILTKWCEQLWSKFTIVNFYAEGLGEILLLNGKIVNLSHDIKNYLDRSLQKQSGSIRTFLQDLKNNNYQLQSEILGLNSLQGEEQVEQLQGICGKHSVKVVRNLHAYIINYLNKLIHTLCFISKDTYDYLQLKSRKNWASPPNLLTLRLGDLMRCKCSSKQPQILRLYEQLNRISKQQPNNIKIIRVKSRLRKGTNDILINIRFKNLYLCEVQLSIKSKVTDFAKRANQYAHFLYELERTLFGPLTQLCSIRNGYDGRTQVYQKMVDAESKSQINVDNHKCSAQNTQYQLLPYNYPFICNMCNIHYFHDNYILPHLRCNCCSYSQCSICQIKTIPQQQLLDKLSKHHELLAYCYQRVAQGDYFPLFGVCVNIESKIVRPIAYQKIFYSNRAYLMGEDKDVIYQITKIDSQKDVSRLFGKYLVLSVYSDANSKIIKMQSSQLIKNYILHKQVKKNFLKQKESISLQCHQLTETDCESLINLGQPNQRNSVVSLFLTLNKLANIQFAPKLLNNLEWIQIDENNIESIDPLCSIPNLIKIFASKCCITRIPKQICKLTLLQELSLQANQIEIIHNQTKLPRLRIFNVKNNMIVQIDKQFFSNISLTDLNISQNQLPHLNQQLGALINLTHLHLQQNSCTRLPASISKLKNLVELNASSNKLTQLQTSIAKITSLQVLWLGQNQITSISQQIGQMRNLKELYLMQNQILGIPPSIGELKQLVLLQISQNKFEQFPLAICSINSLKGLKASQNNFKTIPAQFLQLTSLNYLDFSSCNIVELNFSQFTPLNKLKFINLQSNVLNTLPSFKNCKNLNVAKLSFNQIQTLKQDTFIGLQSLTILDLSMNNLSKVPSLGTLPELKELKLDMNLIQQFSEPQKIFLPKLKLLSLNQAKMGQFPPFLSKCTSLQTLYLGGNNLNSIDPSIQYLKSLKEVLLSQNDISQLPQVMTKLKSLRLINLAGNKIRVIPAFLDQMASLDRIYIFDNDFQEILCDKETLYKFDDESRRKAFQIIEPQLFEPQAVEKQAIQLQS